jgi:hypothetical protein
MGSCGNNHSDIVKIKIVSDTAMGGGSASVLAYLLCVKASFY